LIESASPAAAILGWNRKDGDRRPLEDALCSGPEEQSCRSPKAVRSHDDQVASMLAGDLDDFQGWLAGGSQELRWTARYACRRQSLFSESSELLRVFGVRLGVAKGSGGGGNQ
jgi:hypothetical protein